MYKVLCILTDGFEEGEAVMPAALLLRGGIEVDIAAISDNEATGVHGISISELSRLDEVELPDYDMLFLPGGPHWQALENDEKVREAIRFFAESGRFVAAICASPTILGRMGYLEGRKYTCFTSMNEDFGGTYVDSSVVRDGRLITGRSVAAAIDFGLAMLEALGGKELTDEVKAKIYY